MAKQKKHYQQHRKRLRKRFLQGGLNSFLDYEIIELLLTLGTPRKDCKTMAKDLIKEFGSLQSVLDANPEELQKVKGIGKSNYFGLKLFQEVAAEYDKRKETDAKRLNSAKEVANYLRRKFGNKQREHLIVFYLNNRNRLIKHDIVSIGTVNSSIVHPREVFKPAIACSATKVLLAHNHPSGTVTPSQDDIEITDRLKKTGEIINIKVFDHVIVSKNDYFSFMEKDII